MASQGHLHSVGAFRCGALTNLLGGKVPMDTSVQQTRRTIGGTFSEIVVGRAKSIPTAKELSGTVAGWVIAAEGSTVLTGGHDEKAILSSCSYDFNLVL